MKVRLHEYPSGDWCLHSGAHRKAGQGISCLWRDVSDPPEPDAGPRVPAVEHTPTISRRLAELAREREEAWARGQSE